MKRQKQPFTDGQIRAKVNQIQQEHHELSPAESWDAAIKVLKTEQRFQPFRTVWQWTGFGEKKLWDFLQLLILPMILAGSGFALYQYATQSAHNQQVADRETAQAITTDKANQETLAQYLDQMTALLQKGLLKTKPNSEMFMIAQAKTITVLQSLDPKRQHLIIQFIAATNLNTLAENKGFLYKARMSQADLQKGNLSGANLTATDLSAADLSGANLSGATLNNVNLSGANLSGATLNNVNLNSANLTDVNLQGAKLSGINFSSANFKGANLKNADIGGDLSGANLNGVYLYNAYLSASNLRGAKLIYADLGKANLIFSDLSGADLSGANLDGAALSDAKFIKTNLSEASLQGVRFLGTDLEGANLHNTNLLDADLSDARNLSPQQVQQARNWENAKYDPEFRKKLGLDR
jgi:uncharacterized protein YjbI with pentapeptide repeats